ncbi:MAG: hypothetical protein ACODAB_03880 [Gemmatimonadota bacterium]
MRFPGLAVVACAVVAAASGCTIPITAQTITGGALNAGALLFVDRYNEGTGEGEGAYAYDVRAGADTVAALFRLAVADANRRQLFAAAGSDPGSRPVPSAGSAADDVILARAPGRGWRDDDPPEPETFPARQWTPAPPFSVRSGSPEARGDTLFWVVTHRAARQVAFVLVPRDGGAASRVAFIPYDPPAEVLLSVPSDHAQRNAVEALHQAFYFVAVEHLGREALAYRQGTDP